MDAARDHRLEIADFCRALVDASPTPMAFLVGEGHTLRYVNPAFCLLVDAPEADLIGKSFSDAVPGSRECVLLLDRVYRTRRAEAHIGQEGSQAEQFCWSYLTWPVLSAKHRLSGIMVQVTETTPFHLQAVAMNQALMIGSVRQHELTEAADALNMQLQSEIVQRKQAEKEMEEQQQELKASELRFRGLIEAIPQVVWTAAPDGTLDFANSNWRESFGTDLNASNSSWSVLLHPDDIDRSLASWQTGIKSQSVFEIEHRLKSQSSGLFRWYFTRAVPIRAADELIVKWFGTSTDIDDHKRAELAAFAEQKLESLGVLAGGIAHDFNNLLCVILGGATFVGSVLPKSHALQETVADMVRASERAAHLTRQMLAYAGKGQFIIEPIDINELVRSTCELVRASIPKSVRLTLQQQPELPLAEADSGQMQQVVMNLLLNAAEAISQSTGGSVLVKTDLVAMTGEAIPRTDLVTGSLAPGFYVVIEIRDNGSGMTEATKAHILEPFFTTKFTGRGLGLSAVGGILRGLKGSLEVQSALGGGSTFRVFLPASSSPALQQAAVVRRRKLHAKGTVLVVDDEDMVRKVAKLSLENGGFAVLLADGGKEALGILRSELKHPISLILLDLSMPEMSGRQVMEAIRLAGIEIPILISSGYSESQVQREFSGLDIAGVIPKPFTTRQLAQRVYDVLKEQST